MSQQLINRSPDLKRLRDEGYAVQVKGGYLVIHQIPYVNSAKQVKHGSLVSQLTLANSTQTARPNTHVIYFVGDQPCNADGTPITAITHGTANQQLVQGITVNRSFSNRPPNGYSDYYDKVNTYATIISSPAASVDPSVTPKGFAVVVDENSEDVFQYVDTSSSRANVVHINAAFNNQRIAIVGLGGTGGYILDLVSKTPVAEIHTFDGDDFLQHNAFRSPSAASMDELNRRLKKVEYYYNRYSNMHKGIRMHAYYITDTNLSELKGISYVFVCVDNDSARRMIIQYLLKENIPFIDVGLGVNLVDNQLIGTVRVTTATLVKSDHLADRISFEADRDNAYSTNVQIADLNCLNAVMAVLKWKKLSGFYQDLEKEHHSTYSINVSHLRNEDSTA